MWAPVCGEPGLPRANSLKQHIHEIMLTTEVQTRCEQMMTKADTSQNSEEI